MKPVIKHRTLINPTHFLFIVTYNFNKVTHHKSEESHPKEHDDDSKNPFLVADGIEISITDGTERSECVVTADNDLVLDSDAFLLQLVYLYEIVLLNVFE